MIVTTRAQGVDCPYCEAEEQHEHITEAQVDEALEAARRTLAPPPLFGGVRYRVAEPDPRQLARALIAVAADRDSWQHRAIELADELEAEPDLSQPGVFPE